MKNISILILFFFLIPNISFPQYSQDNYDLVHTTFTKDFNKKIIDKYLFSADGQKVQAALLSIAQSEDTTWIDDIAKIDFLKYGKYACFTLGELGECYQSGKFLLSKMDRKDNPMDFLPDEYEALGKTGNLDTFEYLVNSYNKNDLQKFDGISLAIFNFFIRNIGNKETSILILSNEFEHSPFPGRRNFEAAFALYRLGPAEITNRFMITILQNYFNNKPSDKVSNKYSIITLPYIIGCLRRNKFFPDNERLFTSLLNDKSFAIKAAATQTLCYFPFKNTDELKLYLALLNDKNPNIAREVASSIKNLNLNNSLKNYLKNFLQERIAKNNLSGNTRGELFISYLKLFPNDFASVEKHYEYFISKEYFYQACGEFTASEEALDFLYNKFLNENGKNKITILQSILNFQSKYGNNEKISEIIFSSINSNSPALISIAADGIDSTYISLLKNKLNISSQVEKYKNNPDFLESIMSLSNLAKKIDETFYKKTLDQIKQSGVYSIKKFAYKQEGLSFKGLRKDDKYFHDFWANAFKYKYAEVVTGKGKFKIKLLSQYAPVTTGNFCYLANKKFFNNNIFHRVVPDFVIQGGDPQETGWGGPGYDIVSEFSPLNYSTGMVGMASAGKDTEGSQWFVTTGAYPHLNGRYTIFAKTVSGMNTVNRIDQGDKILKIIFAR